MVVHHAKYTAAEEKNQHSETFKSAKKIATTVLKHFSLTNYTRYNSFITDSEVDPFDRGEEVDLYHLLESYRGDHV